MNLTTINLFQKYRAKKKLSSALSHEAIGVIIPFLYYAFHISFFLNAFVGWGFLSGRMNRAYSLEVFELLVDFPIWVALVLPEHFAVDLETLERTQSDLECSSLPSLCNSSFPL